MSVPSKYDNMVLFFDNVKPGKRSIGHVDMRVYYKERTMQCAGRIVNTDFMYEENVPDIEWTVTDSTKSIGSWIAQKATCFFRGRNYTAWFTADIPRPYGPWKLSGLPGLILEVYDDSRDYVISIQSITSDCSDDMWFADYDYLRLTRKKYLDAREKIVSNFLLYNADFNKAQIKYSPIGEYQRKDLAYGFMELDYK